MSPNRLVNSVYSTPSVCCAEKKSVDSNAIRPIQTSAGHQARRRLGRDAVKSVVNRPRPLLRRVIRGLPRDHDVVHVAFAQSGGADAYESRLLLQFGYRLAPAISHARSKPAYHLMHDHRHRAAIWHATFHPLGYQLTEAVRLFADYRHRCRRVSIRVLEIALARTRRHRSERAHAAIRFGG